MIKDINNLKELIAKVSGDEKTYVRLTTHFDFLMRERIKITKNSLRSLLGRPDEDMDKEKIIQSVKIINEIAKSNGSEFCIEEDWNSIEAFLRLSVMEDIAGEFKKQANS